MSDARPAPPRPERHDLLLVAPADWPAVLAALPGRPALPPDAEEAVRGWAGVGRPVVARRPAPGDALSDAPGGVPVGLSLPPNLGKARVALLVPAGVDWRPAPPATLAEAAALAPAPWSGAVDALLRLGDGLGLVPRVFGALLWQARTGLPYLGPGSDLDLLWPVADPRCVAPLLDGLLRIAAAAPMALDGELLVELDGRQHGVQWRELAEARRAGGGVVLAKSLDRAAFVRAGAILGEALPDEAAACR